MKEETNSIGWAIDNLKAEQEVADLLATDWELG